VATHSLGFTAESYLLHQPPALGCLVRAALGSGGEALAVVSFGETAGLDPSRRALRRSSEEVRDADIYREHPELNLTLRTEFQALLVGWQAHGRPWQHLPPQPPPLHYSVWACSEAQVRAFTDGLTYFRLLLAGVGPLPAEHLLAAHIRQVASQRSDGPVWLRRAAREAASLLKGEYDRLMAGLQGIEPMGG